MNSPTSTCSVESADSHSLPSGPASELFASQKLSPTQAPSCEDTGQELQTSETSSKLILKPMQAQHSSPVDSRASLSAAPGSSAARRTTVSSGRECSRLLPKRGRLGSLVKMLLVSSRWNSTVCCLTWKAKATSQFRLLFQLLPSMPATAEIGSGLWQTPVADDSAEREKGKFNSRGEPKLSAQVKLWPTPRNNTGPSKDAKHLSLDGAVKLWPTPCSRDHFPPHSPQYIAEKRAQGHGMSNLNDYVGGQLNPKWVEWLMGYPPGWTELSASEMPSSRKSRSKSSGKSQQLKGPND